jgi:hypothetical protein
MFLGFLAPAVIPQGLKAGLRRAMLQSSELYVAGALADS